jgi:general secretion pathway protein L
MNMRRLAQWWLGELRALAPRMVRGTPARVLAPDASPEAIRRACAGGGRIVVRVPKALALRRAVWLPLAAERNLAAVLGFEMDRYTPFEADEVYYDYVVIARNAAQGLQVALTVVPRAAVEPVLKALRELGVQPELLDVESEENVENEERNLLPAAQRRASRAWRTSLLLGLASLLGAAVLAAPLIEKAEAVARLEREVQAARAEALLAERARKDLERLGAEENALPERRKQRPASITMLQELTRLLPDGTWLSHADFAGSRVRIRGESENAAALLASIEKSGLFSEASFDGSVTRDPGSERERFAIAATARAGDRP